MRDDIEEPAVAGLLLLIVVEERGAAWIAKPLPSRSAPPALVLALLPELICLLLLLLAPSASPGLRVGEMFVDELRDEKLPLPSGEPPCDARRTTAAWKEWPSSSRASIEEERERGGGPEAMEGAAWRAC